MYLTSSVCLLLEAGLSVSEQIALRSGCSLVFLFRFSLYNLSVAACRLQDDWT